MFSGASALQLAIVTAAEPQQAIIDGKETATGKAITPEVATGAIFEELDPHLTSAPDRRPGGAAGVAVSPDGKRLAILTSGFPAYYDAKGNLVPEASTEYVFLYDISGGKPRQAQVLPVPNTFPGIAWASTGRLFVSGGKDDVVVEIADVAGKLGKTRTFTLGHNHCLNAKADDVLWSCGPVAGDLAASPDGRSLLVTNVQNDSVSLIDLSLGKVVAEQDLRPGKVHSKDRGVPGGSYPRSVVWVSPRHAYVGGVRDREIISLEVAGDRVRVQGRFPVQGQPAALITNQGGSRLYVALDTTGQVAVYDTATDAFIEKFNVVAPPAVYDDSQLLGGANTNAMALTPDGRILLASNGGLNSVAIVRLSERASGEEHAVKRTHLKRHVDQAERGESDRSMVVGLVPTGWYPTGVATARDGSAWYIVNAKSPMGPNSGWCQEPDALYCDPKTIVGTWNRSIWARNGISYLLAKNAHVNQLEHSGFLTMPAPVPPRELARLTQQVARNNRFDKPERSAPSERLFSFLREHIKHVIYIMKENRSYDQILGDLEVGNGDRRLTLFPERISPNHHRIAREFVTLDNLLVTGEGSQNGAYWTFAAQTNDFLEHEDTLSLVSAYTGELGGFPYGENRGVDIEYGNASERRSADKDYPDDPDILPGMRSVYDVDGPGGEEGAGYIWNAAIKRGVSVRGYGVFPRVFDVELPKNAGAEQRQGQNPGQTLASYSDFNWPTGSEPDSLRVKEWAREFDDFARRGSAPSLTLMFLGEDHLGNYAHTRYGVNTPETQMADNDYAVGMVVDSVANSPLAKDTLIITIEDDASDGPDHIDAQRTVALFAGPYLRQHAVVSTRYTTVNVVKTIEEVLGIGPISLNDALAEPMADIFDLAQAGWNYKAIVPDVLRSTQLPLPPDVHAHIAYPRSPSEK
jgi:DNA-binding beta-propeller fold protein YncE